MGSELMSVDPQPVCLVCRRPIATPQQWAAFSEGEETDLCWSGAECGADIPVLMERLAEVTRERDEARAEIERLRRDLYAACWECGSSDPELDASCPMARTTRERDAAQARVAELEAALRLALDGVWCECPVRRDDCPSCVGRAALGKEPT